MNLKTLCWVEEARHKRVHTVWFHLREALEQTEHVVVEIWAAIASDSRSIGKLHEGTFWADGVIL